MVAFARKLRLWRENSSPQMVMMVPVELLKKRKKSISAIHQAGRHKSFFP